MLSPIIGEYSRAFSIRRRFIIASQCRVQEFAAPSSQSVALTCVILVVLNPYQNLITYSFQIKLCLNWSQ